MEDVPISQRKAVLYGEVEIIPGIRSDGYVLDDGTAVMSERGTAKLLDIAHTTLIYMVENWPLKIFKSLLNKENGMLEKLTILLEKKLSSMQFRAEVSSPNSHYAGRKINVYTAEAIETIILVYSLALSQNCLKGYQQHIGERCAILQFMLARTALDAAIKEACGAPVQIQKTAQRHFQSAVTMIQEHGLQCSFTNVATKYDIIAFLHVPLATLNYFLYKYKREIPAIELSIPEIRSIGSKAPRMNAYAIEDVAKIAFTMDTQVGIALKQAAFGDIGAFFDPHIKTEIAWREVLSEVFKDFHLYFNYTIGDYRVDFYVAELLLVLECNGYAHISYDPEKEKARELFILEEGYALVRFHHKIALQSLCNAILKVQPGQVIKLYDIVQPV